MSRPLRVLVYTSLFPNSLQPQHGQFVFERTRQLHAQVEMTVVAPVPFFPAIKAKKSWADFARIPRAETFRGFAIAHPRYIVIPRIGMISHGVSMFAGSVSEVGRLLRSEDFDLIDAHYVYPDGFAATLLGAFFKKPVVLSARGSDINLFSQFATIRPMIQKSMKDAKALIAVSGALKDVMTRLGCPGEKITVIRNGVDASNFKPRSPLAARESLGLEPDRPILLSIGGLDEKKGFSLLIEAVARLRPEFPRLLLVIIGEGGYRSHLENLRESLGLGQNVRLIGALPHEQLAAWYNAADVFCLASSREGCPNVVLEALASGRPVVASNIGGIPEIVTSPSVGILVDRSVEGFCKAISTALRRDWDSAAIALHGSARGWDQVASAVLGVYSKVLDGRQN